MSKGLLRSKEFMVFTFPSTHYTLEGESILQNKGIDNYLFPVPIEIGLGCGTAIKVWEDDYFKARDVLDKENVKYNSIWQAGEFENGSWKKIWG